MVALSRAPCTLQFPAPGRRQVTRIAPLPDHPRRHVCGARCVVGGGAWLGRGRCLMLAPLVVAADACCAFSCGLCVKLYEAVKGSSRPVEPARNPIPLRYPILGGRLAVVRSAVSAVGRRQGPWWSEPGLCAPTSYSGELRWATHPPGSTFQAFGPAVWKPWSSLTVFLAFSVPRCRTTA